MRSAHRDAVLGSEGRYSSEVFVRNVGGDDQRGGVGVTQLVGAVHFTDGPALIGETLLKHCGGELEVGQYQESRATAAPTLQEPTVTCTVKPRTAGDEQRSSRLQLLML